MKQDYNLQRFEEAQETTYQQALSEIKNGRKRSHWMWYVFPQVQGLGFSDVSRYYAIHNLDEAKAYLDHPVLGSRLVEISTQLLQQSQTDAHQIFGSPDDLKLKSSMTLFAAVPGAPAVFKQVLNTFFNGSTDGKTLQLLEQG